MSDPYWIVGDAIIFETQFDECLDNYTDIISNHSILIFSNYHELDICLKKNEICK